jgi:hypothetical protein
MDEIRICLFGGQGEEENFLNSIGVGKSSFVVQYIQNYFLNDYIMDDDYRKQIVYQDKIILLTLRDTPYFGFLHFH